MTTRTAMVIGCGIGGPVAAMALQRAGIHATIYEAYDRPADFVGSFLNLSSNGLDALKAIDAHRPVLEAAFPTPRMVMWSGTGARLGEVANGIALDDGTTSQTIQRGLLHGALRDEAIRRGIDIVSGKRLSHAEAISGRVIAKFEDGSKQEANVLIGADGLHSRVRALIDAAAPRPRDTGLLSLGGRAWRTTLAPTPETFHMIFGRRAFFGYTVRLDGTVYWFANVAPHDVPATDRNSVTPAQWKARLLELCAEDKGPALDILESTRDEIAAYAIFDMPPVRRWHRDGMVIVGDAAHATSPSSGQGASLAIEDAVVLAQCLRDEPVADSAFRTFDRIRRRRVERVVAYSARIGQTKTAGPVGRWIRDRLMPFALRHFANPQAQAWLYRHHINWSEPAAAH